MAKKSTKVRKVRSEKDKTTLVTALAYIVLGALFCVFKASLVGWLMMAAGIAMVALGVWEILKKDLVTGVIYIAIGALFLLGIIEAITAIILIVIGVVLVAKGVLDIYNAFKGSRVSVYDLLVGVISVVVGILLVVSKWQFVDWLFIVVGVVMIVEGILVFFGKRLG